MLDITEHQLQMILDKLFVGGLAQHNPKAFEGKPLVMTAHAKYVTTVVVLLQY